MMSGKGWITSAKSADVVPDCGSRSQNPLFVPSVISACPLVLLCGACNAHQFHLSPASDNERGLCHVCTMKPEERERRMRGRRSDERIGLLDLLGGIKLLFLKASHFIRSVYERQLIIWYSLTLRDSIFSSSSSMDGVCSVVMETALLSSPDLRMELGAADLHDNRTPKLVSIVVFFLNFVQLHSKSFLFTSVYYN